MKHSKLTAMLGHLIGLMPTNILRCFLYSTIFSYRIDKSFIGWKTVIIAKNVCLTECYIGSNNRFIGQNQITIKKRTNIGGNNRFIGPMSILIKEGASIEGNNAFICGWWTENSHFNDANYARNLEIGKDTLITSSHYFDIAGLFVLGDNSWVAGVATQFWTHGAGASDRNITIGQQCYIGSAALFSPGSSIGNNTIIGLGSVVTKAFTQNNVAIAGQPAIIVKENYDWKNRKHIE